MHAKLPPPPSRASEGDPHGSCRLSSKALGVMTASATSHFASQLHGQISSCTSQLSTSLGQCACQVGSALMGQPKAQGAATASADGESSNLRGSSSRSATPRQGEAQTPRQRLAAAMGSVVTPRSARGTPRQTPRSARGQTPRDGGGGGGAEAAATHVPSKARRGTLDKKLQEASAAAERLRAEGSPGEGAEPTAAAEDGGTLTDRSMASSQGEGAFRPKRRGSRRLQAVRDQAAKSAPAASNNISARVDKLKANSPEFAAAAAELEGKAKEDAAATAIQARQRGKDVRAKAREGRTPLAVPYRYDAAAKASEAAAAKIQAKQRGNAARKHQWFPHHSKKVGGGDPELEA